MRNARRVTRQTAAALGVLGGSLRSDVRAAMDAFRADTAGAFAMELADGTVDAPARPVRRSSAEFIRCLSDLDRMDIE